MSFWTGFFWITALHLVLGASFLLFKKYLNNAGLNRILILGIFLLPLLVWIPLPAVPPNVGALVNFVLPEFELGAETVKPRGFNWYLLYLGISGLFMLHQLRGLLEIHRWSRYARLEIGEGLRVYRSPNITMPCSFFTSVFIPHGLPEENESWIIAHEKVHARQFHSADLLLSNLICSLFWLNPFVHFLQKELRLNHEYLADEGVLKGSTHSKDYMNMMMANALRTSPSVFVHPFSIHTHLKNRITYMHQTKKRNGIYLLWIPFMAVLVSWTACHQKETAPVKEKIHEATEVDQMPEMEGGPEAMMTFLANEIVYPENQKATGVEAKVVVQFTVMADGKIADVVELPTKDKVAPEFRDEAIRAVKAMPNWKPGIKDGKAVPVQLILPVRFAL